MSPELFSYVSKFEILPFDPLLSDVHNGIAVEFISKPLQQTVVQTEEQSTKNVNGQMRKKKKEKKMLFLIQLIYYLCYSLNTQGAQWLSGRVLDSRPKGRGFEPHRRHCVVSLSKTHLS